jgi:hypothetical protein
MTAILLALLFMAGDNPAPAKGSLCYSGTKTECIATVGTALEVSAAETARRFVWTSADGTRFIVGELPAKATTIDLADKNLRETTFSVQGSRLRGWPADVRVVLAQGKVRDWSWTIPSKAAVKPLTVLAQPGAYLYTISADHHAASRARVLLEKPVALGATVLRPLPNVTGRVMRANEEKKLIAVQGAQIQSSDGKVLGSSDEQGAFHFELGEPLPSRLMILHPGLGTRLLTLRIGPEIDLGTITLESGVSVHFTIDRPQSLLSQTLNVVLRSSEWEDNEHIPIGREELKGQQRDVSFSDVSPGRYFVTVIGNGPGQRLMESFEVATEDVHRTISIPSFPA